MIAGAPLADYKEYSSSGAVYKCPISTRNNDCSLVDFDFVTNKSDECKL